MTTNEDYASMSVEELSAVIGSITCNIAQRAGAKMKYSDLLIEMAGALMALNPDFVPMAFGEAGLLRAMLGVDQTDLP